MVFTSCVTVTCLDNDVPLFDACNDHKIEARIEITENRIKYKFIARKWLSNK